MDKIERIGTFNAKSEDGTEYTIDAFQKMIDVGGGEWAPGIRSMRTRGGEPVNWRGKGVYDVVAFGREIRVTSDSPDAP